MRDLPHLASRLFGTPLLVDARKLDAIVPAFMRRLNGDDDDTGDTPAARPADPAIGNGVAVVRIFGTLVRRKTMMEAWSGLTSYADIGNAVKSAMDDARVRAVLLQVDSFGGEAPGCFELCDQLYGYRGVKPIWAVADVDALSAGYAILSQADRVFIAPSGSAGSIGAVAVHCERSEMNAAMGITYTVIRAGLRKADLNSYEPLAKAAAEKVQGSLDKIRTKFVNTVARARKGLSAAAARGTEAQWYDADDAVKQKLADGIGTFDDVFAQLAQSVVVSSIATPPATPPEPPAPIENPGDDDEQQPDEPQEEVMEPTQPTTGTGSPTPPAASATPTPPNPAPPTPPATAAAPADNVVAIDSARAEGDQRARAEMREIGELCTLAGKPALAATFLAEGKSLAEVRKALVDMKAKADSSLGELGNHGAGGSGPAVNAAEMWDKAFGAARAAHAIGRR